MKKTIRRAMSLLLAMVMALVLTVPVIAEDLTENPAAPLPVQEQSSTEEPAGEEPAPAAEEALNTDAADSSADTAPAQQEEEPSQGGAAPAQDEISTETGDASEADSAPEAPAQQEIVAPTLTLKVLKRASLPADQAVGFESNDPTVVTVDEKGKVTAQRVGSAVISATGAQGERLLFPVEVESTTIESQASVYVGKRVTLKLKNRKLFSIQTSDESIAEANLKGEVTGLSAGVVDITLTDTLGDIHVCTLKVKGVISSRELTVSEEKTAQLELMGSDIAHAKSSNQDVVTVDAEGTVTGVKEGTATVTLTDESGSKSQCKVTVQPNYLARTAKNAKRIYRKIETLGCRHVSGVHTYEQLVKRRHCSCTTGASLALQDAGVLPVGKTVSHTKAGGESRKVNNPNKAISCRKSLINGTYTLYKANCRYSKLPAKYKQAGMVYVQDSNICVSAGGGYIYSCNHSPRQYRHGHYYNTKNKSGYTHHHKILYVIAPNS